MRNIRLISLELEQFRGIKQFKLEPNADGATVTGANGSGKSTLMAAFLWLLIGKDSQGRENYNIFPLDYNGQRISGCHPTVTAVLDIGDEQTVTLKRCISEVWSKRKGTCESEYKGDATKFTVNEVPVSATEYASRVTELFPAALLPLLLNVAWFSEQTKDYKERRRLLMEQFGDLSQEDVFSAYPKFSKLKTMLGNHSIDEYARICTERRKRYKDALAVLPARIDENRKQLHNLPSADSIHSERSALNVEIAKLRYDIDHITETNARKVLEKEREDIERDLAVLSSKRRTFEVEANAEWVQQHTKHLQEAAAVKQHAQECLSEYQMHLHEITLKYNASIHQRDTLREEWSKKNTEQAVITNICPTCGQVLPEEVVEQSFENFNLAKSAALEEIAARGRLASEDVARYSEEMEYLRQHIETSAAALQEADEMYQVIQAELPPAIKYDIVEQLDAEESKLRNKLQKVIDALTDCSQAAEKQVCDLKKQLNAHLEQADHLTRQLAEIDHNQILQKRVADLEKEQREALTALEESEYGLSMCQEFTLASVNMLTEHINTHFTGVRFKLFEPQKNGGIREICEASVDGVPYGTLNTAAKMQANIEIVQAFSRLAGISMPLFLDNRESVTNLVLPDEMQIINLVVEPGLPLGVKGE